MEVFLLRINHNHPILGEKIPNFTYQTNMFQVKISLTVKISLKKVNVRVKP